MAGVKKCHKNQTQNWMFRTATKSVLWHFREIFFCHIAFVLYKAIFFLLTATNKNYGMREGESMDWQGQPVQLCQLQASELLLA